MSRPQVCVVVSAYNRVGLLADLVAALQAQTVADFEAVLVDNGSTDDTGARLRALTADDRRFRVLTVDDNRGPSRARNLAWRATSCKWVAFTDDDCAPEPRWLQALLDAGRAADIVQGRTIPAGERAGWFDRSQTIEQWSGRFETCNLLVRRELLDRLGGLSERFRIAMGEDTDLGLRAVAGGATTVFADDAVVRHHVWPSGFREFLQQRRRYAEHVELMKVNPQARRLLHFGLVVRASHLVVWGLVPLTAAAIAAGAPWAPVVVVLAWVGVTTYRSRRRPFPWHHRVGYCLLQFLGYAYEAVCFAVTSVRYRTLVI